MATLERIRNLGPILVIIVGIALLAFIVGDFLTSGRTFFAQSQNVVTTIGKEKLHYNDYNALLEQLKNVYKIQSGASDIDAQAMNNIRNVAWQRILIKTLLNEQASRIGLTVTETEMSDHLAGNNPHPLIQRERIFMDESGRFTPVAIQNFMKFLQEQPLDAREQAMHKQYLDYWNYIVETVRDNVLQEKYFTLLGKSVVINNLEANIAVDAAKTVSDVNYVEQPYYAVSDSLVKVTDAEIKAYYEKHKRWYKTGDSRNLNYVAFEIKPSPEDFKDTETQINELAGEFRTTDDMAGLINSVSDISYNDRSVYSQSTVPVYLKEFAFSGKTGDITGPFFHNNTYTMARIMETGINTPDSVRLRHIFLLGADADKRADSIMDVIIAGGDFNALAKQYSAVKQTANIGGEIGWFTQDMYGGMITKEMVLDAFKGNTGDLTSYDNEQGTQIIQAYEKSPPRKKIRLAILESKVEASSETKTAIFNQARQLLVDTKGNVAQFENAAKSKNYIVRSADDVLKNAQSIGNIEQSQQIIRWAFENKKGKVSDEVFECANQYVVAAITDANNTGYRTLAAATPRIKTELLRTQKSALMIKQIAEKMQQNSDLSMLAAALGTEVKQAKSVNFANPTFGDAAIQEPAAIGKVSAMKLNEISAPVAGNSGVYVLQVTNQTDSAATLTAESFRQQKEAIHSYYMQQLIMQDLMSSTKIDDNRLKFSN
ncbi:MAG: SurA N-terminal domain-containing protein [Prevotellaceae bacterium]|jgi:peptidyl-prolyl cis-trans isomerase D|nr:SurA N-terminal domain-containing protein [Prevotellaceae bacterium]